MHLEEFSEGKSFLHRTDPRVKILIFALFSLTCALSSGIKIPAIFLAYSFILLAIANLRTKSVFSRVLIANFFIAFIWLFIPFSYQGNPYMNLGPIKISYEGLKYALSITLKANAIIIATMALISTSSVFSLAHAMLHLKMPKKIVTIFFLFYRYITVIHEEYTKIRKAVALRGFVPKTNIHTYKTYAYIIGGMLLKSYERAEEIYRAMLCRGFKGYFPLVEHFQLRKPDIIFGIISAAVIILIGVNS